MSGRDLLTLAVALAFCGFLVVHAGDDGTGRGLTVKEMMRDPVWQHGGYDPKPALTREEVDKILHPHLDADLRNAEAGTLDAAGQRRLAERYRSLKRIAEHLYLQQDKERSGERWQ